MNRNPPSASLVVQLGNRLGRYITHVRTAHGFAYSLRVHPVIFVAFDIRFNELGRNQPDATTSLLELPSPIVRRSASFLANFGAYRDFSAERIKPLLAGVLALPLGFIVAVYAVHVEHRFGNINTDTNNVDLSFSSSS